MTEDNDVQFEEDFPQQDRQFKIRSRKILGQPTTPSIISFMLNKRIVKNEKQATIIILIIIAIFLSLSVWIIRANLGNPEELMVIDRYGQKITFDQYIEAINRGEDPTE